MDMRRVVTVVTVNYCSSSLNVDIVFLLSFNTDKGF